MKPKELSPRMKSVEPVDEPLAPAAGESPFEARLIDAHAAGEIAQHWYEQKNWPRLAAVLTDPEMLEAILFHRGCCETSAWWSALEPESGVSMEAMCQVVWRRWGLDETLETTGDFAVQVANLLCCAGRYGDFTERLVRIAVRIDSSLYGDESSIVGAHLNILAFIHASRGDYVLAEDLASRSVRIAERLDGGTSRATTVPLCTLASVQVSLEKYDVASTTYRRVLAVEEKRGEVDRSLIGAQLSLTSALRLAGDLTAAERFARRALENAEAAEESMRQLLVDALWLLAQVLEEKADFVNAEPVRRRALAVAEALLGPEHPLTLSNVEGLARVLMHRRSFEEAESLLRRVLAVADGDADADGSNVCDALTGLSHLLVEQKRFDEAELALERCLQIRRTDLAPDAAAIAAIAGVEDELAKLRQARAADGELDSVPL
jgi:tetratricopeptide (TPR) repeat protein